MTRLTADQKKRGGALRSQSLLLVHEQLNYAVIHLIVTRNSSTCFPLHICQMNGVQKSQVNVSYTLI